MNLSFLRSLLCCMPLLVALSPGVASADDEAQKEATARTLFEQASRLMDEKKFAEACPKLEDAVKLAPNGIGARMALAECFEGLGKLASAWATYSRVEAAARAADQADRAQNAHDKAAALKPKLSTLTITVPPDVAALGGFGLKRDGIDVGSAEWGAPLPIDKGDHRIVAAANGGATWSQTVTIRTDGATQAVTVGKPEGSDGTAPAPSSKRRMIGVVVGGVGVAGVVVGTVFGLKAFSKSSDSNADGHCHDGNLCDPTGVKLRDESRTAGNISTVAFIAGGALLGAGVAIFATAPKSASTQANVSVGPGGIELHGTW